MRKNVRVKQIENKCLQEQKFYVILEKNVRRLCMVRKSNRQQDIITFIKSQIKEKGYPPSVREIGEAVGLQSTSTVHGHLDRLERKGLIRRDPAKSRTIEIIDDETMPNDFDLNISQVPIIGKVTAGQPILATENIEDYFPLPTHVVGDREVFMLNVSGDSMYEVGIYDKDLIVVRKQSTANNGEIVVAMTDEDEATVKTFYKEKDHIRLQPENSSLSPILLKQCTILGKVIGVFRYIQ
jgi:repressor LexA